MFVLFSETYKRNYGICSGKERRSKSKELGEFAASNVVVALDLYREILFPTGHGPGPGVGFEIGARIF